VSNNPPEGDLGEKRYPTTVELTGIPGAGKSWMAVRIAARLADCGVPVAQPQRSMAPSVNPVRRISRKLAASAAAGLHDPGLSLGMANGIVHSKQPSVADMAARFIQWQVGQRIQSQPGMHNSVRLLDEGLVQCLWSIGLRGTVEPALGTLAASKSWRKADLLVVVRTPAAIVEARLASRVSQHSRTQQLALGARRAELEHGERLLDHLVHWWTCAGSEPRPCVEVSGPDRTGEVILELVRRIAVLTKVPLPSACRGPSATDRHTHVGQPPSRSTKRGPP
jgi:hypothetical protein